MAKEPAEDNQSRATSVHYPNCAFLGGESDSPQPRAHGLGLLVSGENAPLLSLYAAKHDVRVAISGI
jgi:hypothetical protein